MEQGRYRWVAGTALAVVMVLAMAAPAMAASSVTVNAQVQAEAYSITLDDGSDLDYGALDMSAGRLPLDGHVITVRNIGTDDVKLDMIGSDATNGTDTWTLSDRNTGPDQFVWGLDTGNFDSTLLNPTTAVTIKDSLLKGASVSFYPALTMPTSTSGSGHYSWTGTIYASATL